MKNLNFTRDVMPHLLAVAIFLIVTIFFFKPYFFDNKVLQQHDIQMFQGSAKAIQDFREKFDNEPLWTNAMFGGMPAYLISVQWSTEPILFLKSLLSLWIGHPIRNIFLAFICYYILLLSFKVRPYLAIGGAIAFGLSSFVIIGLSAGHNARIGAIAFMPLVLAGIHLVFTNRRLLGFAVTAAGLALHLQENHLQMTYYLLLIVLIYGLVHLIEAIRDKGVKEFFVNVGLLVPAVLLAVGTFFGQFWAVTEYTKYSTRGKSELSTSSTADESANGLSKTYAFEFSNGILEPLTLLIPNIYGGSSGNYLVSDPDSKTLAALRSAGDQQTANQLARYSSAYWGPQRLAAPYYAGAIIVFLFAIGVAFAQRKYVWWLVSVMILGIMLSWGDNFATFNYLMFDYFPGYNKFRSVTFTLIMILIAMPLLGFIGLERLMNEALNKVNKRKLLIAFASTAGICVVFTLFAGMLDLMKETESQLPAWFLNALTSDRASLLRSDAIRSASFITAIFILLYFGVHKKISPIAFYAFLAFMITIDLAVVDKRYFTEDNYKRKRDNTFFATTEADKEILKDDSHYRVFTIDPQNPFGVFSDARSAYHYQSIGGYHGAKMRRYQDFIDSCLFKETQEFFTLAQQGNFDFSGLGAFNMLNIKYLPYGPGKENIIRNNSANGNAWFVSEIVKVNSPSEELAKTCAMDTRGTAVIDISNMNVANVSTSADGKITLVEGRLNYLKYESESATPGLAVFSEIYYPAGWIATIDGQPVEIIRANYILRALNIPGGKHVIEFEFKPRAYTIGNKVTLASSWLVLIVVAGGIFLTLRKRNTQ